MAKRLGKTKGGFELFKLVIDRIRELQKDLSEEQQIDMNNIGGYRYAINVVSCEKCVEKSHCTCNNGITHIPFGEDNLLWPIGKMITETNIIGIP